MWNATPKTHTHSLTLSLSHTQHELLDDYKTEYLVSDTSASKSTRQFQTLNRKLDMLAEALVATEIQGRMAQGKDIPQPLRMS